MEALLHERPAPGFSEYEFTEEAISRYLLFSKDYARSLIHLWYMLNLRDALEHLELSNKEDITQQCDAIIEQAKWNELIKTGVSSSDDVEFFYAANVADRLKIDVDDAILSAIKAKPVKNSMYISRVYKNADHARELTELYESILPLEEMATGMGEHLFATKRMREHLALDAILQELQAYPHMGESLVLTALKSPVTRERNGACKVLNAWSETLGQSVATFSPNLYEALQSVSKEEVKVNTKETN
jgi:hypothetical protein